MNLSFSGGWRVVCPQQSGSCKKHCHNICGILSLELHLILPKCSYSARYFFEKASKAKPALRAKASKTYSVCISVLTAQLMRSKAEFKSHVNKILFQTKLWSLEIRKQKWAQLWFDLLDNKCQNFLNFLSWGVQSCAYHLKIRRSRRTVMKSPAHSWTLTCDGF